jgi:hypothetical protein
MTPSLKTTNLIDVDKEHIKRLMAQSLQQATERALAARDRQAAKTAFREERAAVFSEHRYTDLMTDPKITAYDIELDKRWPEWERRHAALLP